MFLCVCFELQLFVLKLFLFRSTNLTNHTNSNIFNALVTCVKCLEGTTERSDGNRVRSARIGEARPTCLEGTTPQDMPQSSALIEFVKIRATEQVAIFEAHCIRVNS